MKRWFTEIRYCRRSASDAERGGRPIEKIHEIVLADCESNRHIVWLSGFDFELSLGHEKVISKMGALFAHNLLQTQSCDNLKAPFGVVQPSWDKEGQGDYVSQQSYDDCFLRGSQCSAHWIFSKWMNNHWRMLCALIEPIQWLFVKKKTIVIGHEGKYSSTKNRIVRRNLLSWKETTLRN